MARKSKVQELWELAQKKRRNHYEWQLVADDGLAIRLTGDQAWIRFYARYAQCEGCLRRGSRLFGEMLCCGHCRTTSPILYRAVTLSWPRQFDPDRIITPVPLPASLESYFDRLLLWHPALFSKEHTEIQLKP